MGRAETVERIKDFEDLFDVVTEALESNDLKKVALFITAFYDDRIAPYIAALQLTPDLAKKLAEGLAPLAVAVLKGVNAVRSDKEFQSELEKSDGLIAKTRFVKFHAYKSVGFSTSEAFQLVLHDAANSFRFPDINISAPK